jgi:hypothetical protein
MIATRESGRHDPLRFRAWMLSPPLAAQYLQVVATRKINLPLDEELVRRARQQAIGAVGKSDAEVIEDALAIYLGDRALDAARAAGPLEPDEADRLALEEVHAVRQARRSAV